MKRPNALCLVFLAAAAGFVGTFTYAVEGQTFTAPTEAPAGFDNKTNGFLLQSVFEAARGTFEERDSIADGLGPVYNAQSCAECHQNPVPGGISQVTEVRAGYRDFFGNFYAAKGKDGSLIHDRAIDSTIQEYVPLPP